MYPTLENLFGIGAFDGTKEREVLWLRRGKVEVEEAERS